MGKRIIEIELLDAWDNDTASIPDSATEVEIAELLRNRLMDIAVRWRYRHDGDEVWHDNIYIDNVDVAIMSDD